MGRYLREARRLAGRIDNYYQHAGQKGYAQALYYWNELNSLVLRANRSFRNKNDLPIIHDILRSMQQKMDEMKARETEVDKS